MSPARRAGSVDRLAARSYAASAATYAPRLPGPRANVGQRVDEVVVVVAAMVATVVRGEGTVPDRTVGLPGAAQRVGQGTVGPPPVVVCSSLVDRRPDERVPQRDHVVGLHQQSGVHGGS